MAYRLLLVQVYIIRCTYSSYDGEGHSEREILVGQEPPHCRNTSINIQY